MSTPTQAVATTAPQQAPATRTKTKTIKSTLEGDQFKLAVAKVLPRHLTADRFIRVAIMAITRTPKLAQCDEASFFQALMNLSQMGLEPDGRRAHLIPFMNRKRNVMECQLIVDFKGLAELVMRSGMVSNLHADVVCDNDEFDYDRGELKAHKIDFRKPRGPVYAVYSLCRFKDGSEKCEVMTRDEVEGIRKRSRAADSGPWVTDWNEMAKKTVFRRLSKWLSLSPEFRDALDKDSDSMEDLRMEGLKTVAETTAPTFEIVENAPEAIEDAPEQPQDAPPPAQTPTESEKPQEPAKAAESTPKEKAKQNYTKAVKGLLALAGVSEVDLIGWLTETHQIDDSVGTLTEMAKVAELTLVRLHDTWSIADGPLIALKAWKAGKEA